MKENHITWEEYFMGIALLSAKRSKDPNTKVGACIVNDQHRIISVGYNGMPNGCNDSDFPWDKRDGILNETKYAYVCHSELNAILNSQCSIRNATLYVTLFPCNECAKVIIQSGIKEIIYLDDKYSGTPSDKASKKMLDMSGIKYRKYTLKEENITLNL